MPEVVIRAATSIDDRRAVIQVAFDAMGSSDPLGIYEARRLKSALRSQAEWLLLEEDGVAAGSLLCYPLRFRAGEEVIDGFGLGAVATRRAFQKRGHASRLCQEAALHSRARGRTVGLLFSAIPPAFYERLGYRIVEAWEHRCAAPRALADSGARARLRALDPRREIGRLMTAWDRGHSGLHIHRDEAAWHTNIAAYHDDLYFAVESAGVLRVAIEDQSLEILELFATEPEPVIRAAAGLSADLGLGVVETWLPPLPILTESFERRSREQTLPMVNGDVDLAGARFWGSDYF